MGPRQPRWLARGSPKKTGYASRGPAVRSSLLSLALVAGRGSWSRSLDSATQQRPVRPTPPAQLPASAKHRAECTKEAGRGPCEKAGAQQLRHRGVELGPGNQERVRPESQDKNFGCREVDAEIQAPKLEQLQRLGVNHEKRKCQQSPSIC